MTERERDEKLTSIDTMVRLLASIHEGDRNLLTKVMTAIQVLHERLDAVLRIPDGDPTQVETMRAEIKRLQGVISRLEGDWAREREARMLLEEKLATIRGRLDAEMEVGR